MAESTTSIVILLSVTLLKLCRIIENLLFISTVIILFVKFKTRGFCEIK